MQKLLIVISVIFNIYAGLTDAEIKDVGWWRNTVFYQVYPRSFKDGNNDGVGDLQGITTKLEHFKDSGIGAIWLSPIFTSPMVDFGYDISNFREIEPAFGTMADFEGLVNKAKTIGIKVILDLVPNHSSDKHEWFIRSVKNETNYRDYYIWRDCDVHSEPKEYPNNWISLFGGSVWKYNEERKQCYMHQFEYRQPDLNYNNPDVVQEMIDIIEFWLDKGIDGFRVDATPFIYEDDGLRDEPIAQNSNAAPDEHLYLDHIYTKDDMRTYDLMQKWRNVLDKWADEHDDTEKVMMTEAYSSLEHISHYYTHGSHIPFNFNFITEIDFNSTPKDYKKIIDDWMTNMEDLNGNHVANWVMGNHDRKRIGTRFPGRSDQLTILALTLPGVGVTYYGEEIGMVDNNNISWEETQDPQACNADPKKYKFFSRDPSRTPFQWDDSVNTGFNDGAKPWIPIHPNYRHLNLEKQKQKNQSPYKLYTALTKLREDSLALKEGTLTTIAAEKLFALVREHKPSQDTILVLINFSNNLLLTVNASYMVDEQYKSAILHASSSNVKNVKWGTQFELNKVILPSKATYILKLSTDLVSTPSS